MKNNTGFVWTVEEMATLQELVHQTNITCHIRFKRQQNTTMYQELPPSGLFFCSGITTSGWKTTRHLPLISINHLQIFTQQQWMEMHTNRHYLLMNFWKFGWYLQYFFLDFNGNSAIAKAFPSFSAGHKEANSVNAGWFVFSWPCTVSLHVSIRHLCHGWRIYKQCP